MRRHFKFIILIVIMTNASYGYAGTRIEEEYEVKAAFIYNIMKFVEWQDEGDLEKPLKICVIGKNPFDGHLDILNSKQVRGRRITVARISSMRGIREAAACHALFISRSEKDSVFDIIMRAEAGNILTIGDTPGFAGIGVGVNFYMDEDRVRFEINRGAVERAGLKMSSKLLMLARPVLYTKEKE